MKIGIQALGVIAIEPDNAKELGFRAISEAGFEGVDFSLESFYDTRSVSDPSVPCFYDRSTDELKKFFAPYADECAKYCLEFIQAHAPFINYTDNGSKAWGHFTDIVKHSITIAGFLGSPYIVVHPLISGGNLEKHRELELNRNFFLNLSSVAMDAGVKICIENLFCYSGETVRECVLSGAEEAMDFIEELNSDAGAGIFKYCLDIGHATLLKQDVRGMINIASNYLAVTHLHDNNGIKDLHALPFSVISSWGSPSVPDWNGFIRGMQEIKYDGTLSFETAGIMLGMPEELKAGALSFIASAGKYLRKTISCGRENRQTAEI